MSHVLCQVSDVMCPCTFPLLFTLLSLVSQGTLGMQSLYSTVVSCPVGYLSVVLSPPVHLAELSITGHIGMQSLCSTVVSCPIGYLSVVLSPPVHLAELSITGHIGDAVSIQYCSILSCRVLICSTIPSSSPC